MQNTSLARVEQLSLEYGCGHTLHLLFGEPPLIGEAITRIYLCPIHDGPYSITGPVAWLITAE
jgi:hypothetical protein